MLLEQGANSTEEQQVLDLLSKKDLAQVLVLINKCLLCSSEDEFDKCLQEFAAFLDYDFVLYAYTTETYKNEHLVHLVNLSNPEEWALEYTQRGFLRHDPVRHEMERILETGIVSSFILWDNYIWDLSPHQQEVIDRRNHYGLQHGFSFFTSSEAIDFTFIFSFARKIGSVDSRDELLAKLVGPHLMVARKRMVLKELVATLSEKEKSVVQWIMDGKTNWEIANILNITANTVKYHNKNIFAKLQVTNRQQAIAVLLAERYLRF